MSIFVLDTLSGRAVCSAARSALCWEHKKHCEIAWVAMAEKEREDRMRERETVRLLHWRLGSPAVRMHCPGFFRSPPPLAFHLLQPSLSFIGNGNRELENSVNLGRHMEKQLLGCFPACHSLLAHLCACAAGKQLKS